ncbi:MAG: hypothetical protein R3314_05755, partial [Longimicrobiales bacterium]|nr:hypothetical protein [Longimicrobiales bacterium]
TVRSIRSEYDVPARADVTLELTDTPAALESALGVEERSLRRLATVGEVRRVDGDGDRGAGAHAVLQSGAEVFIPLEELIDVDRERERLRDELDRIEGLLASTEQRLSNDQFVEKAPAEVVEREREKAESFRDQRARLSRKLTALT